MIIGNSAAGIFAAEAIRNLDRVGRIDIIGDENYPAYARCLTSYYLTGRIADEQMLIRPADFYTRNDFNLHKGQKAVRVDPEERKVHAATGETYHYDRLLIATGASPAIPNLPGVRNNGVFGLRTMADAKGILGCTGPGKSAVVVGGGRVSLKAAYALLDAGLFVTCIISSGQMLSQVLDRDAAGIVAETLTSRGLTVEYHTDVTEILGAGDIPKSSMVSGVRLTNGKELPANVVIIGKGVIPNTGFLEGSGIELSRGVLVNEFMQTNLPDIYAAGDVAQGYDLISGRRMINAIWPNAAEQGNIAGCNMAGFVTSYSGSIEMNSVDFFGLSIIAAGQTRMDEGEGCEVVKLFPGDNLYRRLVFKNNTLVGYIMVGKTAKAGLLTTMIREQVPLGKMKEELAQGRLRQKMLW
ncbi:MAG: FAD-dependent oxidoreductase [Pseudomonadota bacterium]|nr:FAD-dependent oxidoreductase [Patescibacteria group bacterium]